MSGSIICRAVTGGMVLALAVGLAACGSGGGGEVGPGGAETTQEAPASESEAFIADMTAAVTIINDQLAAVDGTVTQIMLASDVDKPTQKYGMWVMPYYPSEAVAKFISTIQVANGTDFVVTATSAETGKEWTMDQDGNMAEVVK